MGFILKHKFIFGFLLAFLIFLVGFTIFETSQNNINEKEDPLAEKYKRLEQLSTEVQLSYFKELLGNPVFVNYSPDRTQKEHTFVDDQYFVQAITNQDNKVLAYSVTTREKDFQPNIIFVNKNVFLGKTKFSEIESGKDCYGIAANWGSYYFEKYSGACPGFYQHYLFGVTDTGYWPEGISIDSLTFGSTPTFGEQRYLEEHKLDWEKGDRKEREETPINTYMIISPFIDPANIKFGFGPNINQIRLIR